MQLNGKAGGTMSSDEEENTHVTFKGGRDVRKRGDHPRWSRLELLLAALCVLLATVSVVLVVIVAAQNIHKGQDNVVSGGGFASSKGRGQGPYTVVPGGGGDEDEDGGDRWRWSHDGDVCLTPGCAKAAAQILSAMNTEADPCEDFFQYACGTWNSMHLIADDMSHVDNFVTLNDNVQAMLKDLLEAPITDSDLEATKKAKDLYASCINETAADEEGLEPVKRLLAELGGWPVVEGDSWAPPADLDSFWASNKHQHGRYLSRRIARSSRSSKSSRSRGSSKGGSGRNDQENDQNSDDNKIIIISSSNINNKSSSSRSSSSVRSRNNNTERKNGGKSSSPSNGSSSSSSSTSSSSSSSSIYYKTKNNRIVDRKNIISSDDNSRNRRSISRSSRTSSRSSRRSRSSSRGSHVLHLLAALRRYNSAALVSMSVGPDERSSLSHIVQLDQSDLGMPSRDYYLGGQESSRFLKVYETYAREVALLLGANPNTARRDMEDMLQLEIRLANITTPPAHRRDVSKLYNRKTLRQLHSAIPGFDWLTFAQIVMGSVGTEVKDTEEVVVYAPEYFRKMAVIYEATSERTLVNYMIWRLLMDLVKHFPRQYRAVKKDYHKTIFGAEKERSRWRECVKYTSAMDAMGDAAGRLFVHKHFDQTAKKTAVDMIHNIREAFYELVEEAEWMDEPTRVVAREKAQAVSEQVGYADSILNDTALNLKYDDVTVSRGQFFNNVLMNSKHVARVTLSKLRKPVDKSQWLTTATVVNAFYIATRNMMTIPAAILQPPFYNKEYPKSLNYGGIGMVIGHEITHGFDDKGRQYDKVGNLVQWWDDVVIQRFKGRAQCIIDQYSNFTMDQVNMQVNGVQTQGENIADNGGIKEAYRAYRKWVSAQGREEPKLPGLLQYTHDQLFFINFAQVWCGTMRPEAIVKKLRIGPHSPARFRVIGTLQNQPSFSQAFNCPPRSYMNPAHKCVIW